METATKTRGQLALDLAEAEKGLAAFKAKPIDEWTEDDLKAAEALKTSSAALKADLEKFGAVQSIHKAADDLRTFTKSVQRPALGGSANVLPGDGSGTRRDGSIEPGESENEKFVRQGPWKGLGHFAWELKRAGKEPGRVMHGTLGEWNAGITRFDEAIKGMDPALKAASGLNEFSDAEGGAFVPVNISNQVWDRAIAEENLLSLVDVTPVSGNGLKYPAWNDKSRSGGTLFGGAKAYWGAEGAQKTASMPRTRDIEWRLNKLYVLMYATDELLEDATALESKLSRVAGECIRFETNKAIVTGNGIGQPLGILNTPAKITQAAVSSQGASTIVGANIPAMWMRRPPGANGRLVWLYPIGIEGQLAMLNFASGSAGAQFLFTSNLKDASEFRLLGRPMIESEHLPALGTEGDLILWDPKSYGVIVKSTGIQQAVSMHLRFDYDETAFRWVFRIDGRPMWDDVLTPANGDTRAPVVTLSSTRT